MIEENAGLALKKETQFRGHAGPDGNHRQGLLNAALKPNAKSQPHGWLFSFYNMEAVLVRSFLDYAKL